MKKTIFLVYTLLLVLFISLLAACSAPRSDTVGDTNETIEIDAGALYATNCSRCHGDDRQGVIGPALTPENLESLSDVQVKTIISDGKGRMPSWGSRLTDQEIEALVQLIKHTSPN